MMPNEIPARLIDAAALAASLAESPRDSISEDTTMPKRSTTATVEFTGLTGDPHPEAVLHALAGVCAALDQQQPTVGDHDDLNLMGGLACAAAILSRHLIGRLT